MGRIAWPPSYVLDWNDPSARWAERIRTSLTGLLSFRDVERGAGRLLIVGSHGAGASAFERREHVLAQIIAPIDEERQETKGGSELPLLTAEGNRQRLHPHVHGRRRQPDPPRGPLLDLRRERRSQQDAAAHVHRDHRAGQRPGETRGDGGHIGVQEAEEEAPLRAPEKASPSPAKEPVPPLLIPLASAEAGRRRPYTPRCSRRASPLSAPWGEPPADRGVQTDDSQTTRLR
jgi:hypothetical protein